MREYESKKIAVSGAVKNPGTYEMLGPKTLLEMISIAGGLDKDFGRAIVIFRQNPGGATDRIAVDLERLVYGADPQFNVALLPGDIVYVPVIEKTASGVTVKIGSAPHPMEEKHFIEWIEIIADGKAYRQFLKPGDAPEATFDIQANTIEAREHCNIHGLWKA